MSHELSETDGFLPLSGLQHVIFCERQAALIHIERVWQENTATALGRIVHERADQPGRDHRRGVRVVRAMPLHSSRLRVVGVADTVEYHRVAPRSPAELPFPVEYKRGRAKSQLADQVQLCARRQKRRRRGCTSCLPGAWCRPLCRDRAARRARWSRSVCQS